MNSTLVNFFYSGLLLLSVLSPVVADHSDHHADNITVTSPARVFGGGGVLPLTLIEFKAQKNSLNKAELIWKTAQEVDVSHFNVEKSNDGRKWVKLGVKQATGQQGTIQTYYYTDPTPIKDANYYRLHVVDEDGHADYSPVRLLISDDVQPIRIYPTLATSSSTFYVEGISPENTLVEIYSSRAKLVHSVRLYSNSFTAPQLKAGIYYTRIINSTTSVVVCQQKIMIQ